MKKSTKKIARRVSSKTSTANSRGKVSKLAAKKFYPTAEAKSANPRRKDSFGFKSLEIIRRKPGIDYSSFRAAGGRPKDVNYDIKHGFVAVR